MNFNILDLAINDIDALTETRSPVEVVRESRLELGRDYIPVGLDLIIRTDPMVGSTRGGIILTARESSFYNGPPHQKVVKATVITTNERSEFKPGDRVCFQRLYFKRIVELRDKTFVGSINETQLIGLIEEE